jgi:sporulation protein YabP
MPFAEKEFDTAQSHHVTLEDRQHLTISGVEDVERFDENTIVLRSGLGLLTVRGSDLHIETLSLNGGDLRVEGTVDALCYEDPAPAGGSLLARLFR